MLSFMGSEDIIIELSEPNNAGIIVPSQESDGQHTLMLVMPVMMKR